MPRKHRIEQERAILAHQAHLNLLRGMANGIEKVLPPGLCYLIITFENRKGQPGGYVSNGERRSIAKALKATSKTLAA
jgi:hypothetical protein